MIQKLACAKINLGLHVKRKRADGYHDLETVFLPIPLADTITVRPADRLELTCSDSTLPTDDRNLCKKAARLLASKYDVCDGAAIHLEKRVPYGAGLGGGSSDAATTLQLLCGLWSLQVSDLELHTMAFSLGSDVPFFLGDGAAYATGRGEQLTPLTDPSTGVPYHFPFYCVLVVPPVHIPTASAYTNVRPDEKDRPDLRAVVTSNNLLRWETELVNDFEGSVFLSYPPVRTVKESLLATGAGYASLSGSGSAVFGLFEDKMGARRAADRMEGDGYRVYRF